MKKILTYLFLFVVVAGFSGCSDDDPDYKSIITDPTTIVTPFDTWLFSNYVTPYNIEFKYKLEDNELNALRVLVPAEYDKSVAMAKLVKHLCIEAYSEERGANFTRQYFPKIFHLVGSASWLANGSRVLGEAEGGRKITLFEINALDLNNISVSDLNDSYFKTIHHEFGHILHQTKNYPTDFKDITGTQYLTDAWDDPTALPQSVWAPRGFVSAYSRMEANEDFVEILAHYLVYDDAWWTAMYASANSIPSDSDQTETGATLIKQKLAVVKDYMKASWDIDLDELRAIIARRQTEVSTLDLRNL